MKKILLLIIIVFISKAMKAQLPNGDFENWVANSFQIQDPVGWETFNYGAQVASQYQPAENGSYALKLKNDTVSGSSLPGILRCYFRNNQSPTSLDGFIIGHFQPNDLLIVTIDLYDSSMNTIANGFYFDSTNNASYIPFSVPITYSSMAMPDSAFIVFNLTQGDPDNYSGYVILDNLSFGGVNSINESKQEISLNNWPNPAHDIFNIELDDISMVTPLITIIDMQGRIVPVAPTEIQSSTSKRKFQINISDLENGNYFYSVAYDNKKYFGKIVVAN